MIIGCLIDFAIGALCVAWGWLIWKKQRLSLIHEYHYKNVKAADVPAYARLVGISLLLIGAGICATGLLSLAESRLWWAPMTGGLAAGLIVMNRAQKRYNGSWFS